MDPSQVGEHGNLLRPNSCGDRRPRQRRPLLGRREARNDPHEVGELVCPIAPQVQAPVAARRCPTQAVARAGLNAACAQARTVGVGGSGSPSIRHRNAKSPP